VEAEIPAGELAGEIHVGGLVGEIPVGELAGAMVIPAGEAEGIPLGLPAAGRALCLSRQKLPRKCFRGFQSIASRFATTR